MNFEQLSALIPSSPVPFSPKEKGRRTPLPLGEGLGGGYTHKCYYFLKVHHPARASFAEGTSSQATARAGWLRSEGNGFSCGGKQQLSPQNLNLYPTAHPTFIGLTALLFRVGFKDGVASS